MNISIEKNTIYQFSKTNEYIFFGDSALVDKIMDIFGDDIKACFIVDNNKSKIGTVHRELIIKSASVLDKVNKNTRIIITAGMTKAQLEIIEQLKMNGLYPGEAVILASDFIRLWKWHYEKKIAINYVEQIITSKCTLNCKHCGLYIPFYEKKNNRNLSDLKADLECLFKTVDYVAEFRILGGEPLMHSQLEDLLEFIIEKYRENIGILAIVTNGTLIPTNKVLRLAKDGQIMFHISDYTENLKELEKNQIALIQKLEEVGIKYSINRSEKWVDVGNPRLRQDCTIEEIIYKFEHCKMSCRSLLNGRLYFCGTMASAILAKIYDEKEEDSLNLRELYKIEKTERFKAIEAFEVGSVDKGFIDYCYYCNGFGGNNKLVPSAIQK